jgi:outer membrane murein-binding lipoprotein Lpp
MKGKQFLLFAIILSISLLATSCVTEEGPTQEEYDALLAERDAAQAEVESLETQVDSLEDDLSDAESEVESIENDLSEAESDLAAAESLISSLTSDLENANSNLAEAEEQLARLEAIYTVVLFFDDYETGDASGWDFEGDWAVIQEDSNYVLRGVGPCSTFIGSQEWTDYVFQARIKFSQSANVNFRFVSESETYLLNILPEGLRLNKQLLTEAFLAQSAMSLTENEWIDLKIETRGNNIKLYVDGTLLLSYTDRDSIQSGSIGFVLPENSAIYVDDVIVMVAR